MFDQSRSHLPNLFSRPGIGSNIFLCCNVVMNMDLLFASVALKDKDPLLFLPIADIIARCKDKNYVWRANALTLPVHNVQFVKYDVTVSFMAQVLDTVTYLVPQVLDTAS